MKYKTAPLSTTIAAIIGTAGAIAPIVSSAIIPDGHYRMVINNTPYANGIYEFGSDGNWNSSFTFGNFPGKSGKTVVSQAQYDNGDRHPAGSGGHPLDPSSPIINVDGLDLSTGEGSSLFSGIFGDGVAGLLDITVTGNSFTVNTFNKDVILKTAGGSFFQQPGPSGTSTWSGTINGNAMIIDPTGRRGSIDAPVNPDRRWNVDDCGADGCPTGPNGNTTWLPFTTSSVSNVSGTVNGTVISEAGDKSGTAPSGLGFASDSRNDFDVTLVTGGFIGSDWGFLPGTPNDPGFFGANFFEVWNITIYSLIKANDDSDTTNVDTTKTISLIGNGTNDTTPFPPLAVDIVDTTSSSGGTIVNNNDGTIDYTPPAGFTGVDTFSYTISDADPGADPTRGNPVTYTDSATVTINVNNPGFPSAADDSGNTAVQNGSVVINVTTNDTDPGGSIDPATVMVTTATGNGLTAVNSATGAITYTPATDFIGTDSFGYTVDDNVGNTSNEATVTVTVSAVPLSSSGTVTPGSLATGVGSSDGKITAADVPADPDIDQQCVGGCYDFVISGLAPGAQVTAFLPPLSTPIPASSLTTGQAQYRKLQGGTWVDFDLSKVASAPTNSFGACPSNLSNYTPGLNAGDVCLALTLTDGSTTDGDDDGSANGTIVDPGGVGIAAVLPPASASRSKFDTSGCTITTKPVSVASTADWWLVAGFMTLLGWMRRRRSES